MAGDAGTGRVVATGRLSALGLRPTARATNLSLLIALLVVFATGVGAVATGSPQGRWVVIAHGVAALVLVALIPWKSIVVRRGLRRGRAGRWASVLLVILVLTTLVAGLVSATGLVRSVGGFLVLWLHIAVALGLVPLLLWHLFTRPVRLRRLAGPRRGDLSRRSVLRAGVLTGLAATGYVLTEAALRVTGAPGARRRFTGSHPVASADPASMPVTSWLDDRVPTVDAGDWRLAVVDAAGRRELTLAELGRYDERVRATLDCTSGWYAEHEWAGVPVSALLTPDGQARSLYVHSVTGYWVRLPVDDLDGLLLATRVAGTPLGRGHGFPLRLVAPGRRGFWWVKWVDRIELDTAPVWWQPPFPVT